jgi:cell division protein FtsL
MRILNILVIIGLVAAAAYVYEIKFQATLDAERLAKMRGEIRRERDAIAALKAEWAKLQTPRRIEGLAQRHLPLKPIDAQQISSLDNLPDRPKPPQPEDADPIGAIIEETDIPTASVGSGAGVQ